MEGRVELGEIERVGNHPDDVGPDTEHLELAPLGLGHGEEPAGAANHVAAHGRVEHALGEPAALDDGRGAVWREHVGHAGAGQLARGGDAREVAAGVEMRHVELARVGPQEARHPAGEEELGVVRQRVGRVREHVNRHARRGPFLPRPDARRPGRPGEPAPRVAGVGRHDRDVVAGGEAVGEGGGDPRDAAVGPGPLVVGSDVEDPQMSRPFGNGFYPGAAGTARCLGRGAPRTATAVSGIV